MRLPSFLRLNPPVPEAGSVWTERRCGDAEWIVTGAAYGSVFCRPLRDATIKAFGLREFLLRFKPAPTDIGA